MDPWKKVNQKQISEQERMEMAWNFFLQNYPIWSKKQYTMEQMVRNSFKRVDEFLELYQKDHAL